MKKILMIALLALAPVFTMAAEAVSNKNIDGNWFSKSFGARGDSALADLNSQLDAYKAAKAEAEADSSNIEARKLCAELAIRSGVRAQYWAEVGRLLVVAGDKVGAKDAYTNALKYAKIAQMNEYATDSEVELAKIEQNKKEGTLIARISEKALAKLK